MPIGEPTLPTEPQVPEEGESRTEKEPGGEFLAIKTAKEAMKEGKENKEGEYRRSWKIFGRIEEFTRRRRI